MLATTRHGDGDGRPLIIAHGLFGSARNWGVIARGLSADRPVIAVDMRNHGASPWTERHTYPEMAHDLAEVITAHGGVADILGHSMGGKAAMALALSHGEIVSRLIVADIAPVSYGHSQLKYLAAMRAVDLDAVGTRRDADRQLQQSVSEPAIRAFLLQSLDVPGRAWRLNLDTLERDMEAIMAFPKIKASYHGPTLFLSGGASDYVDVKHRPIIHELFPRARLAALPDAGHWLHAEKPADFIASVRMFLDATGDGRQ